MKKVILITLVFFAILMSGCSKDSEAIKNENIMLKNKISQLEEELKSKGNVTTEDKGKEKNDLTINYIENTSSKRFVEKQLDLLALPTSNSIKLNSVLPNTIVTLIDTVNVDNIIWLYVSIPVYDSPSNYKGWIKEVDTLAYTKDTMSKVQSNIIVKSGAKVYETESFEGIKTSTPYKSSGDEQGRIQERKEGYIKLECAGGKTIWVKDTEIIYPEID